MATSLHEIGLRRLGRGALAGALATFCVFGALGPGCKKKQQDAQFVPTASVDAAPPPPTPTTTGVPDAAAAVDSGPAPLDMLTMQSMQTVITERAKKDARGMKPFGDFFGGVVEEGGSVQQTIMIDTGKCYGVIAMGSPGVTELDIQVQAKPGMTIPLPGPVIAVDSNTGPEAAVSPCWKNPFPLGFPALVVLKATRGKGPVGGQVYVK